MPTVMLVFGWRIVIYPNDHRPAHVHVIGSGGEAVFDLHCPAGPPELRENYGCSLRDLNRLMAALHSNLASCCARWKEIHGDYD